MEVEDDNLWIAAGDGRMADTLRFLGSNPVDFADENGYTALMAASAYGKLELVKELLKLGANPNLKDSDGNTAIHHCEYVNCLSELIAAGGKVSTKNSEGQTACEVKQEELATMEEEFSDEEELEEGETEPTSHRLSQLVSKLVEYSVQEETRKKTKS